MAVTTASVSDIGVVAATPAADVVDIVRVCRLNLLWEAGGSGG